MKTRILPLLLMLIVTFSPTAAYRATAAPEFERTGVVLSTLSAAECREFLAGTGFEILRQSGSPFVDDQILLLEWGIKSAVTYNDDEILHGDVIRSEERPEDEIGMYGSPFACNRAETIRMIVNLYYGRRNIAYCFYCEQAPYVRDGYREIPILRVDYNIVVRKLYPLIDVYYLV